MAVKFGNDYRLWVEGTTAGTYSSPKGQQNLSYSRKAGTIDTSTKDSVPYSTSAPGNFDAGVTLNGIADLPDATGFGRLDTQYKTQSTVKVQIRKNGTAGATPADVVLEVVCYILDLSVEFPQNGTVPYTLALSFAAAPTIDTLQ